MKKAVTCYTEHDVRGGPLLGNGHAVFVPGVWDQRTNGWVTDISMIYKKLGKNI
jgi:hypothetical protein